MTPRIRPATQADIRAINTIYNHYVRTSTCTWHLTEETDEGRTAWLRARGPAHPALVIEIGGETVGWGSISSYNTRQGWSATVEDSAPASVRGGKPVSPSPPELLLHAAAAAIVSPVNAIIKTALDKVNSLQ